MKAIKVFEPGGSEKLCFVEVPLPKIKKGWSLIQVIGFGINHSEIFTREGKSPSVDLPRILGIECVGMIYQTSDETKLKIGQKVISIMGEMGRAFDGSYAEYVLVPNEQIYPVEIDLSWTELATLPESYYTAYGSLLNMQIKKSDSVLIRGATSGVGLAFLRLLKGKFPNILVSGTTRNFSKKNDLISAGFDEVIKDEAGILATKKNFNKIFELVGPLTVKNSFKHLNEYGILCSTGQLGGQWYLEQFDPIIDIKKNSYLTSFYSGNVELVKLNELFRYIAKYKIKVRPEKIFKLEEIRQAHEYLQSSKSFGKVIILNEGFENL